MTRPRHRADDHGGAEVVAVILIAPVVVGFVVLLFYLGRQVDSRASVRTSAASAAQAAARQRDAVSAEAAATRTVRETLKDSATCAAGPAVSIDLTDFRPGGIVTVDVTCTIRHDDLAGVSSPRKQFTGHGAAIIDMFKAIS